MALRFNGLDASFYDFIMISINGEEKLDECQTWTFDYLWGVVCEKIRLTQHEPHNKK